MRIKLIYTIFLLSLVISTVYSNNREVIIISESSGKKVIGEQIEYFEDKTNAFNINNISKQSLAWNKSKSHSLNFEKTSSSYWFRFTLRNTTSDDLFFEITYPLLDYIEFYRPDKTGTYIKHSTGDTMPFDSRMISDVNFIFKIEPADNVRTYYLKVRSAYAIIFTPILWPEKVFHLHRHNDVINWFFYGMFFIITILILTLFAATRDKMYMYFIMSVLSIFFFFFCYDGYSFMFLWPDSPQWANKSVAFAITCMIVFSALFIQSLLYTKSKYPIFHKTLYTIIFPGIMFMVLAIIFGGVVIKTMQIFSIYAILLILSFVIAQAFKKNKMSLFLLISILPYSISILLNILHRLEVLSFNYDNSIAMKISTTWMSILFGLIIIDRHTVFKRLLVEKDKIVEDKNQELLLTNKELQKINKKLSKTMKELKTTNQELLINQQEQERIYTDLIENEMRYHTLFESAGDGIMVLNGSVIIDCNVKTLELFDCSREQIIGQTPDALSPSYQPDGKSSKKSIKEKVLEVHAGKKLAFQWKYNRSDNTPFDVEITLTPLILGTRFHMLALIRDITERITTQNELVLSESRLAHAQRIAHLGNWEWNIINKTMYWSDEVFKIYGIDKKGPFVRTDSFIKSIHPEDKDMMQQAVEQALRGQAPFNIEHRIILPDGTERIIHADAEVSFDKNNRPLLMFGTIHDITELIESKKAVERSLAEKEVLLKEVHHRVKNNLGIIYSLLHFEKENMTDNKSCNLLTNIQSRIQSMALIHQKLYQSSDLNSINFAEYCRGLVDELLSLHNISESKIAIDLNIQEIFLPIEKAMPCGLILNELVTNSFKYAFPKNKKGKIIIAFSYDEDLNCTLIVEDTGIGIPDKINTETATSLGMFIIRSFTEQLNGTMSLSNNEGTNCTLHFSL